jgi:AcrR family transcriptional regulator
MARRGEKLREHILWVAKDVFLRTGFERASMDVIALQAETSKRTMYAYFANKEKLYLAVIELVRGLFLSKLKTPAEYSGDPHQALVLFGGRFLEALLYSRTIKMCRLSVAGAERFPEGAASYFGVLFREPQKRLNDYLQATFALTADVADEAAQSLLGRIVHPRFARALFGLDPTSDHLEDDFIRPEFDLGPIRQAVAELLECLNVSSANSIPVCKQELSDSLWELVLPLLPAQRPKTGRPGLDHRQVINGILWVLDSDFSWRDLPARYGSWRTVYSRYRRWQETGLWPTIMAQIASRVAVQSRTVEQPGPGSSSSTTKAACLSRNEVSRS